MKKYKITFRDGSSIVINSKIKDITFDRMSPEAKQLKEALGSYKKVFGSHTSTGKVPYKPRQSGPQVQELNECINEAYELLASGIYNSSAWNRLTLHLDAWNGDPKLQQLAKRAASEIRKFEKFIKTKQ